MRPAATTSAVSAAKNAVRAMPASNIDATTTRPDADATRKTTTAATAAPMKAVAVTTAVPS